MNKKWVSIYIYFQEGVYGRYFNQYLIEFVKILLEEKLKKYISKYFFIRYADKGPHIRLRVLLKSNLFENTVKQKIENFIKEYFKDKTLYIDSDYINHKIGNIQKKYFNKQYSFEFLEYEAENKRYGGIKIMPMIEEEFYSSSKTVLNLITKYNKYNYGYIIGIGYMMMISLFDIFLDNKEDKIKLAKNLLYGYLDAEIGYTSKALAQEEKELINFMKNQYKEKNSEVNLFVNAFNKQYHNNNIIVPISYDDNLYSDLEGWRQHLISTKKQLIKNINLIECDLITQNDPYKKILSIATSMLHLNANRLGMHLIEEAWLAFLYIKNNGETI